MEFRVPELGEGVYEAELVSWLVKPGDAVRRGQNLAEVMTDKATMEMPSPFAGTIRTLRAVPGKPIQVGQVLLEYDDGNGRPVEAVAPKPAVAAPVEARLTAVSAPPPGGPVKAAPSVRQLARKLGIDLMQVRGSGPDGRILIEDLAAGIPAPATPPAKPAPPEPDYGRPGTRIPLAGLRRRIAEHLVHSIHTIPHYTYVDECDVTDLVRLRASLKEPLARTGVRLTYVAFVVKAVAAALREVPLVNASLDEASGHIVLHDCYHVGVAVATPAGLVVPVVRDADKKDLVTVAREVERLGAEARAGKSKLDDLRGGTFTVTSIGNIGGLFSTPIIHHPEVGILGIGKVVRRPVFDATGALRPAEVVYLSFSFDHRVVDGAVGAAFGNAVSRQLREPGALLVR